MFSQASVILFTGGGMYPSMHWADTPPRQTRPDTPLPSAWLGYTQPPCPVHAGIHPPAQCMLGYNPPAATAADGTHPTGMHSC